MVVSYNFIKSEADEPMKFRSVIEEAKADATRQRIEKKVSQLREGRL